MYLNTVVHIYASLYYSNTTNTKEFKAFKRMKENQRTNVLVQQVNYSVEQKPRRLKSYSEAFGL